METPILVPGTGAAVSGTFSVERNTEITVQIYPEANIGADTAELQRAAPDGSWVTCRDENGIIALSGSRPQEVIFGPGAYQFDVAARGLAWGISMNAD
jgi:hypothetical protein